MTVRSVVVDEGGQTGPWFRHQVDVSQQKIRRGKAERRVQKENKIEVHVPRNVAERLN